MTAEVAILNKSGVALAADSAVSIGRDANKIWTSADKVFQLSEVDPVGVMIYGNADFHGLPWETLIKAYRKKEGRKSFRSLEEHPRSFFRFLKSTHLFPPSSADYHYKIFAEVVLTELLGLVRLALDSAFRAKEKGKPLTTAEIRGVMTSVVEARYDDVTSHKTLSAVPGTELRSLKSRYRRLSASIVKELFGQIPLTAEAKKKLQSLPSEYLSREHFTDHYSGVVFAGFGSAEAMPRLLAYFVEERMGKYVRHALVKRHEITHDNSAIVIPFAQQEMVHTFMDGVVADFLDFMKESTRRLFDGYIDILEKAVVPAKSVDSALTNTRDQTTNLVNDLFKSWDARKRQYWYPVVSNVASLPKDELAAMAEAFVNLTKFRRRVTTERETVGGPIDVAVITPGDGFVWVKRKHYFDPSLNPRAIARYSANG